jgi:hypothetical protein
MYIKIIFNAARYSSGSSQIHILYGCLDGLLQMTQSLIFLDPISDVVPIGHSIYKKKTFKFYIIVSFKTTIQYMYLTGS